MRIQKLLVQFPDLLARQTPVETSRFWTERFHVRIHKRHVRFSAVPKVRRRFVRADIIELLQHRVVRARWRLKRIHLRGIREERHAARISNLLNIECRLRHRDREVNVVPVTLGRARRV